MSRTIDEEVVKMSLDTKEFESDISSSISSIEKLKSSFNFEAVAQGIQSAVSNIASIGSTIGSKVSSAVSAASEGVSTVKSGLSSIGEFGSSVVSKIKSGVGEIASNAKSAGSSIMSGISDIALKAGSLIGNAASTIFSPITSVVSGLFGKATDIADKELFGPAMWIQKRFWEQIEEMGMNVVQNIWSSFSSLTFDQIGAGFGKYGDLLKSQKTIMAAGYDLEKVEKVLAKVQWYTDNTSYSLNDMTSNIGKFTAAGVDLDDAATAMIGIANAAARAGQGSAEAGRVMYNVSQSLGMGYMQLMDWKSIENANMATLEFKQTLIDAGVALGKLEDLGNGTYRVVGDTSDEAVFEAKKLRETLSKKWLTSDVMLKAFGTYGSFVDDVYKLAGDGTMTVTDAVKQLEAQMGSTAETAEGTVETISQIVEKTAADSGYLQAAIEVVRGNYGNDMTERFRLLEEAGFEAQKVQDIVNRAYADGITSTQGMIDAYSDLIVTTGEVTTAVGEAGAATGKLGVESFKAAQQAITFEKAIDMTKEAAGSAWASVFKIVFGDLNEATDLWTDFAEGLNDLLIKPVVNLKEKLLKWSDRGGRDDLLSAVTTGLSNIADLFGSVRKGMELVFPKSTTNQLVKFTKNLSQFISGLTLTEDQLFKVQKVSTAAFNILSFGIDSIKAIGRFLSPIINAVLTAAGPVMDFLYNIFIAVGNITHGLRTSDSVYKSLLSFANGAAEAVRNLDVSFKSFFGFSVLEKLEWIITKVKEGVISLRDSVMKFIGDHNFFRSITDVRKAMADIRKSIDFGAMLDSLKGKITEFVGHLDVKFKDSYGFSLIQKLKPFVELIGDAFEYARKGVADFFGQIDATNIKTLTESMSKIFGGFSLSSIVGSFGSFIIDWLRDLDTDAIANIIRTNVKGSIDSLKYVFNEETFKDPILILNRFGEELGKNFEKIKMWAEKTGPVIKESLKAFGKMIIEGVKLLFALFKPVEAEAGEEVDETVLTIEEQIATLRRAIVTPFDVIDFLISRFKAIDLESVKAFLGGIGSVVLAPFAAIKTAFTKLGEVFNNLKSIDFTALKEFLGNLDSYRKAFLPAVVNFFTGLGPAIKIGWGNFVDKIKELGERISNGFSEFFNSIRDAISAFVEGIHLFGQSIADGFNGLIEGIGAFGTGVVDTVKLIGEKIKIAGEAVKKFITENLGISTLDDVIVKIGKIGAIHGGFGLTNLLNGLAKLTAKLGKIDKDKMNGFLKDFGNFKLKVSGILSDDTQKAISKGLLNLKDVLKTYQWEIRMEAIKEIAKAVLILAAGIAILALLPKDKLLYPAIIVGALFTAIVLMSKLMKGMESLPTAGAVMAIAGAVLIFAAAVAAIVGALNKLKKIVGDGANPQLAIAIVLLAGIIGAMVGIAGYLAKLSKGIGSDMLKAGASLIMVALAVDMMVGALMVLTLADPVKLIEAAAAVGLAIIALGAGLRVAAKPHVLKGAAALLIAAAAIDVMLVSILALTAVFAAGGQDSVTNAMVTLVAAIVALSVPLAVLSGFGPNLLIVAASFLVMSVAVKKLVESLLLGIATVELFSLLAPSAIEKGAANLELLIGHLPGIVLKFGDTVKALAKVIADAAPELAIALVSIIGAFFATIGASFTEVILGPIFGILWDIEAHATELGEVLSQIVIKIIQGVDWWLLGSECANFVSDFFLGAFGVDRESAEELETAFGALTTSIADWFTTLFDDLRTGKYWENITKSISDFWDGVIGWFKEILGIHSPSTVMQGIAGDLIDGLIEGFKSIPDALYEKLQAIGDAITGFFLGDENDPDNNGLIGDMLSAGGKLIEELAKGIAEGVEYTLRKCGVIGNAIADYFFGVRTDDAGYTMEDKMNSAGEDVTGFLGDGMSSNMKPVDDAIASITSAAEGAAQVPGTGLFDRMYWVGEQAANGLSKGVKSVDMEAVMEGIGNHMANGCEAALAVNSPSKVFMRIGESVGEGLVLGVNKWDDRAVGSVVGLSDHMTASAGEAFGQISDILDHTFNVNPTIRPSVDLSNVTAAAGYMSSMFYDPTLNPLANKAGYGMLGSDINIQNKGTDLTKVLESMADIRGEFSNMSNRVTNLQVRMDTGALVGSIVEPLDTRLGSNLSLSRRGIK